MRIRSLRLRRFRNHTHFECPFPPEGFTLFHGPNGSGKTSILEAVHLLIRGNSFRERDRRLLIQKGEKDLEVEAVFTSGGTDFSVRFFQRMDGFSEWLLLGKKTHLKDMARLGHVLSYQSSHLQALLDTPALLRKWFNQALFGLEIVYLEALLAYNKALKSKGSLIRAMGSDLEIRGWNRILADHAEILVNMRKSFSEALQVDLQERSSGRFSLAYQPDHEAFGNRISGFEHLERSTSRERIRKTCLTGPHRDRWNISWEGRSLQSCSSGERKQAFVHLLSSYLFLYQEQKGTQPLFIADDFDTALDEYHVSEHLALLAPIQLLASAVGKREGFSSFCELISHE